MKQTIIVITLGMLFGCKNSTDSIHHRRILDIEYKKALLDVHNKAETKLLMLEMDSLIKIK